MLRTLVTTAFAATAIFGAATAANATIYNVTSAGLYNYGTVDMSGTITGYGAFSRTEYAGAVVLQGTTDAGTPFSVVTFCFDLLHNINVGFNSQGGVSYTYSAQPVTTDLTGAAGAGSPLSASQIERMTGLARTGAYLLNSGASNLTARISAIQAAIWSVEYGLSASNFSVAGAGAYYTSYLAKSFPGSSGQVLVSSDGAGNLIGDSQGLGLGAVPEPESWALMIVGFGLIGVSGRRRRSSATAVAA